MRKLKGCPKLVQSDTYPSITVSGESHTRTYMLECLKRRNAPHIRTVDAGCGKRTLHTRRTNMEKVKCRNCSWATSGGCCDKAVMSLTRKMLKAIGVVQPNISTERDCKLFSQMTNGDKLRRMSNEELSDWLKCPQGRDNTFGFACLATNCYDCVLKYLEMPCENPYTRKFNE